MNSISEWETCWNDLNRDFRKIYPVFIELLTTCERPTEQCNVLLENVSYNLSGGKNIRGTLVSAALVAFSRPNSPDPQLLHCAHLVGWCIEMLHAGFLVMDDLVDGSEMRRGKPSWFRTQNHICNGLVAVNDGLHLILTAKHILYKILTGVDSYPSRRYLDVVQLIDTVSYRTCWGQSLDIRSSVTSSTNSPLNPNALDTYTLSRFEQITTWKTGYYTFYLPIACGLAIAGVDDEKLCQWTEHISLKLGRFFQAQDDFLDCFGDVKITGKVGTDIADGKTTWLIVECLSRASPDQVAVIAENYGRTDPEAQSAVRQVYANLKLPEVFKSYENCTRLEIVQDIKSHTTLTQFHELPNLFRLLVEHLFGRNK